MFRRMRRGFCGYKIRTDLFLKIFTIMLAEIPTIVMISKIYIWVLDGEGCRWVVGGIK